MNEGSVEMCTRIWYFHMTNRKRTWKVSGRRNINTGPTSLRCNSHLKMLILRLLNIILWYSKWVVSSSFFQRNKVKWSFELAGQNFFLCLNVQTDWLWDLTYPSESPYETVNVSLWFLNKERCSDVKKLQIWLQFLCRWNSKSKLPVCFTI